MEMTPKMTALIAIVDCRLSEMANEWRLNTYKDFAIFPGRRYAPRNKYLHEALTRSAEEDHAAGRPFRCALVCNSDTCMPGDGFFQAVAHLRGPQEGTRKEIWMRELHALMQYVMKKGY